MLQQRLSAALLAVDIDCFEPRLFKQRPDLPTLQKLRHWTGPQASNLEHASWPALRSAALPSLAQLAALPTAADLAALTQLVLESSSLQPLPAELALCTGLRCLHLIDVHNCTSGWEHLGSLQQLTRLALSISRHCYNNVAVATATLPPSVAFLTGLKQLVIDPAGELDSHSLRHLSTLTRLTLLSLDNFNGGLLPTFLSLRSHAGLRITGLTPHWAD